MMMTSSSSSADVFATGEGHSRPACAACKHQRRKCLPDCKLAPYFPGDQPAAFCNAHRLFGINNMLKAIQIADESDARDVAMRTVMFHSNARELDPVHGCVRTMFELRYEIARKLEELNNIRGQLSFYHSLFNQQPQPQPQHDVLTRPTATSPEMVQQQQQQQQQVCHPVGTSLSMVAQQQPPPLRTSSDINVESTDSSHFCDQNLILQNGNIDEDLNDQSCMINVDDLFDDESVDFQLEQEQKCNGNNVQPKD